MKVSNMKSYNGNAVPNQFIITQHGRGALGNFDVRYTFQSYDTVIAIKTIWPDNAPDLEFDRNAWDYSRTTAKYRNQFTGLDTAETKAGIKDGSIRLTDLNK